METNTEKMEHFESLFIAMIDVLKRIDERKIEIPEQVDYLPAFNQLGEQFEQVNKLSDKTDRLVSAIAIQKDTVRYLIERIPKKVKTHVEHRFSDRTRPYIFVFVIALFVTALSVFGFISLVIRNSELKENDIKFRMVRLRKPSWAKQVDADYFRNADSLKRLVKFEELEGIAVEKATKEILKKQKDVESSMQNLKKMHQN